MPEEVGNIYLATYKYDTRQPGGLPVTTPLRSRRQGAMDCAVNTSRPVYYYRNAAFRSRPFL